MRLNAMPIPFETLQNEMDRMLTGAFPARNRRLGLDFDLFESDSAYELIADLPGVDESAIELALEGRVLTIKARRATTEREDMKILRRRRDLEIEESIRFPVDLDGEHIVARFHDGELRLVLPKHESRLPRKIEIRRG